MKPKYTPTRAELLELWFNPRAEWHQIKWIREIKPYNPNPKFIIYRETHNSWGYWWIRYNVRNQEDIITLIKLLSKGK